MSWVEQVRTVYRYNQWANGKVLDAAAQVSDEELARPRPSSGGSIANDLAHIVRAQETWFARLAGEDRPEPWDPPDAGIISALRSHYYDSHERLHDYTQRLTEDELTRVINIEWQGETYTYRTWQILLHLANHGTQHRAEVGIALLAINASPGDLDIDDFYFLQGHGF